MLDYLKLYESSEQLFEPYSMEQRGRLLTAMMAYAFRGQDTKFDGNERFVWPALKRMINACEKTSDKRKASGSNGAINRWNRASEQQTIANDSKPQQSMATYTQSQSYTYTQSQVQSVCTNNEQQTDSNEQQKPTDEPQKTKREPRFSPPTLEQVKAYCAERQNKVDPQRWFDYYSSNGWLVGRNHMRDWKAAVRTWQRNDYSSPPNAKPLRQNRDQAYTQREYTQSESRGLPDFLKEFMT